MNTALTASYWLKDTPWSYILGIFLFWRIGLLGASWIADYFLAYDPSFPHADIFLETTGWPRWMYSWANFDGIHYLHIAAKGYESTGLVQAFFPVYPNLILLGTAVGISPFISGLLISNFAFLCASFILFVWIQHTHGSKIAWTTLMLLYLFPTSFYFGALYSESLFLLLAILGRVAYDKRSWKIMAATWAMASGTRIIGVFLPLAILIEQVSVQYHLVSLSKKILLIQKATSIVHFFTHKPIVILASYAVKLSIFIYKLQGSIIHLLKHQQTLLWYLLLSASGLVLYMLYLQHTFGDYLYFFRVQEEFGGGREERIILLPQIIWRYIRMFLSYHEVSLRYVSLIQEFVMGIGAFVILWFTRKKLSPGEITFCLLALLLPTLTGTLSSMPRYVLVCFPLFRACAEYLNTKPKLLKTLAIGMSILLIGNTMLFIQGYWVA